jgi:glycosyltransferase involved in cell wall biosynthesis
MQPLISVIVATYKHDDMLLRALNSLASQTYKNFEIIVVDDNANEEYNSRVNDVITRFRLENENIKLNYIVNKTNLGSAKTRNVGIDASNGEYITFLDDDDLYLPENLEKQVENMLKTGADYGLTDIILYYDDESLCEQRIRNYIKSYKKEDLIRYHLRYHLSGTDTLIFKKDYLEKIGKFGNIDFGDEFLLMLKAIENDGKFTYLPGCYIRAYIHRGEVGLSNGESKINGENTVFEIRKKYFGYLSKDDQKFVITRHFLVLAFAEFRRRKYFKAAYNGVRAFFVSPVNFLRHIKERKV